MKTKTLILIIAFMPLYLVNIYSQELVGGYSLGHGNFLMSDSREILAEQLEILQQDFSKMKTTDSYPSGLFHNAYIGMMSSMNEFGLKYDRYTTGGRNHLKDKTGEIYMKELLKGDAIGLYYKFHFISLPVSKDVRFSANVGLSTGLILNKIDYTGELTLNEPLPTYLENDTINRKGSSVNWYIQPTAGIQFWFKNRICLHINAGYEFDVQGKVRTPYQYVDYYTAAQGREHDYGIDWSGLRVSAGIGFAFSAFKK